jgi:hypothetical protein
MMLFFYRLTHVSPCLRLLSFIPFCLKFLSIHHLSLWRHFYHGLANRGHICVMAHVETYEIFHKNPPLSINHYINVPMDGIYVFAL